MLSARACISREGVLQSAEIRVIFRLSQADSLGGRREIQKIPPHDCLIMIL